MASKYKRGRKIRSVGDFEKCNEDMFFVVYGLRHRGWFESQTYRSLKKVIALGMYVAKENKNDS